MLINANHLEARSCLQADVCVLGAGAAGITVALQLAARGYKVILVESGSGSSRGAISDRMQGMITAGSHHPPVAMYRREGIGGTTSAWGGRCVPYDPIDFEKRDYIPESGWPIQYSDIAHFYPQACAVCDAGDAEFSAREVFGGGSRGLIPGLRAGQLSIDSLERFSLPTNFGNKFGDELRRTKNIQLIFNAVGVNVQLVRSGNRVESILVAKRSREQFRVQARCYVLAMGGLETARLLLESNDVQQYGIGNFSDQLGRYYMCHTYLVAGRLRLDARSSDIVYGYERDGNGIYCRRRISVEPEVQKRLGMVNMVARLHIPPAFDPAHRNSVLSMLHFGKIVLKREYRHSFSPASPREFDWREPMLHARNIVRHPSDAAAFAGTLLTQRFLAKRKLPSVALCSAEKTYPLDMNVEQIPLASSRVFLSNDRDAYGMRRLLVDWRHDPEEMRSIGLFLQLLKDEVAASGCGQFEYDPEGWQDLHAVGGHHIGTTRMAERARLGVVDANCKVFDVQNLYLCSSGVFPTSSHANPVLTLVALAFRLVEHLHLQHSEPPAARG